MTEEKWADIGQVLCIMVLLGGFGWLLFYTIRSIASYEAYKECSEWCHKRFNLWKMENDVSELKTRVKNLEKHEKL